MSIRTERVSELLQREMGDIFSKELPRNGALTTILAVKVTPDLSIARFYLSVLGSKEMGQSMMAHIQKENKNFRKILSGKLRHHFRRMPELEFYQDELQAEALRMEELIRRANASSSPPAADADGSGD
ncbi:MAG: 30S ribosome-binding factor RbfA [Rhizobacter sp.]|nr:30S ribosome-binding factor RbfA [Chlorobiales bacterium]